MNIELHLAKKEEAAACAVFIDEAREYQNEQGFVQWTREYPNIQTILEDIRAKRGYTLTENGMPFGYLCIDFEGEPAYDRIEGEWLSSQQICSHS